MKKMATSFKRTCALTDTLSGPNPAPRLHQTPGHSQASLGQSLVGSLLLSPGFWCIQGSVCALPETVFPVSSGGSMVGLTTTSSRRTYAIPAPRAPAPQHSFRRRRSNTVLAVSVGSLGPGVHKACLSPPSISVGNGV